MLLELKSRREYNELVVGIVGAVGSDTGMVQQMLEQSFAALHYPSVPVHLIELLHEIDRWEYQPPHEPEEKRIREHMDAGDDFRDLVKSGDAIAALGIGRIRRYRASATDNPDKPPKRQAYILKSLKRSEEIELLREVYGPNFVAIGAYAAKDKRVDRLAEKIAQSHNFVHRDEFRKEAEELVFRDLKDVYKEYGQDVRSTFPLVDVFVDSTNPDDAQNKIERFLELLFGNHFHTPTPDEYAMFHAFAAALRSGSLSRQVGAVITTGKGHIVALGTNEVPKYGGGQYWCDDEPRHRDIEKKIDSSDVIKKSNLAEVLDKLASANWLTPAQQGKNSSTRAEEALKLVGNTRVMQPLEFGRAVHAEMAAIVDAAVRGVNIKDATLYTTTFPCHECARHIIAAGLKRVVYIEPYPKSLAAQLHDDEIALEAVGEVTGKVRFDPFVGVAPRQYANLFIMFGERKADGKMLPWTVERAVLRRAKAPEAYVTAETDALAELSTRMERAGLRPI